MEEVVVVTLVDQDGHEHDYEIVDVVEFEDRNYAVLMPHNADGHECTEEDHEALLLRVVGDADLAMIEDEDEFNRLVAYLESLSE